MVTIPNEETIAFAAEIYSRVSCVDVTPENKIDVVATLLNRESGRLKKARCFLRIARFLGAKVTLKDANEVATYFQDKFATSDNFRRFWREYRKDPLF